MVDPSHKGKEFPEFQFTVERGKLKEFVLAIADDNPAFAGDDPPLPPTFPTVFAFWGGAVLEDSLTELEIEMWNVLHAEQEYEYLAPIHIGDTVTGHMRVEDIYSRGGQSGQLTFIELITEYRNQKSDPVLRDRFLLVVRE